MEKELGIVFAGGAGPGPEDFRLLVADRMDGALCVAADSGLLLAHALGVRPDWVVGDMDSLDDETLLLGYPDRVIRHPVEKDLSDTELALDLLRQKGCTELWIIGGGGGRIAHSFAIRDLFEREDFPQRWITENADIRCLDSGTPGGLSARMPPGRKVSVFPLAAGPWQASSSGLQWPLEGLDWKRGFNGLSNAAVEETVCLRAEKGRFLVVLENLCRQS
ncbi:MAG: thiamine diphosphokinase [Treponema sp.]|nr:thiamine diphosphokinase [Treponema sp.]